jgi:general secretion pathway protein B
VSLILDALRRADSERERERGVVPGLHAQQVQAVSTEAPPSTRALPWLSIAIVAAAGLLAAAAWFIAGREAPRPTAAPAVAQLPAASPAPSAAASIAPAPAPAVASPRANAAEPQPVAEPAPWSAPDGSRKTPAAEIASAPAARTAEVKAVLPAEAPITAREQLPENIRAQLPPLAFGGSIYSASAPDRSVIIDGRIFRENDRLTADLTLEQIRPKAAVLRYKGYRFEIGF